MAWTAGRTRFCGIELKPVRASRVSRLVGNTCTRPVVADGARVPHRTVVQMDMPATDEVGELSSVAEVLRYFMGL